MDGARARFGHPSDAIRAGIVLVPADRSSALLMQRSVRENVALPRLAGFRGWGLVNMGEERERVGSAIDRLQIDTRAQSEVQRLSGGNQQKVTIARWLESGVRTFLFYDPTRGIDIRTKAEIYGLVRELAGAGAAVLLLTSELEEIKRVCDRAIVIFGGRVVEEMAAEVADEPTLLRAAHGLEPSADRERFVNAVAGARDFVGRWARGDSWTLGLIVIFVVLFAFTKALRSTYGLDALAIASLPVAFAAAGQAIVVISGGIDLSIGSVMALTNVIAASMLASYPELSVPIVIVVLLVGLLVGAVNGILVVVSRVPDIVVTLAMLFVWAGVALLVLGTPGGASTPWLREISSGTLGIELLPRALIVLLVVVGVVWIPLRRSQLGLSIYAVGSNRLAAFRSGVHVEGTKIVAYALTGLFASLGGLALTASTGIGTPIPGPYLLLSVAAIVLGGVSLAGGRGGLLGPIVGIYILGIIRADLTFLGMEPAFSTVIQGVIMVIVVMVGAYLTLRRRQA